MLIKCLFRIHVVAPVLVILFATAGSASPAGHWSGRIDAPGNPLEIEVDLDQDGDAEWRGTIDIPAQGATDFPLANISVEGSSVTFAMSGVAGEPTFRGEVSEDGKRIEGEFSQQGATFPFQLERTADAELPESEGVR